MADAEQPKRTSKVSFTTAERAEALQWDKVEDLGHEYLVRKDETSVEIIVPSDASVATKSNQAYSLGKQFRRALKEAGHVWNPSMGHGVKEQATLTPK